MAPPLSKDEFACVPTPKGVYYENKCFLLSHPEVRG
jgi:hypothetical protein